MKDLTKKVFVLKVLSKNKLGLKMISKSTILNTVLS